MEWSFIYVMSVMLKASKQSFQCIVEILQNGKFDG